MEKTQSLLLRWVSALGFGIYFGVVVLVELAKNRRTPETVQMLVDLRGPRMQTEVRVNGVPIHVSGVEGIR